MIDYLRKKVSGHKNRYQDHEFDLDLTYITPRIIAMSLPGEGLQKMYRNSIDSVARFLKEKHRDHYKIINLSGLRYDYEKFNNKVCEYLWEDHYPPSIQLLFHACHDMHQWLCTHRDNVITVNCKAGKGRTGTLICCYLIYSGRFQSAKEALDYYKYKRFLKGGGVTQPSQVRYVHYFAGIFEERVKSPSVVYLEEICIKTVPRIGGHGCRPVFEMLSQGRIIYTNKKGTRDRQKYMEDNWMLKQIHLMETVQSKVMVQGDVQCNLINWGVMKMKNICRFTFNSAFIPEDLELVFDKRALDPDNFRKNKDTDEDFQVILKFSKACPCTSEMSPSEKCEVCTSLLLKNEYHQWILIKQFLSERIPMNPSIVLFTNPEEDDVEAILSQVSGQVDSSSDGSFD